MNILLVGLGSIGKRHLYNIIAAGNHHITVVSSKKELPADAKNCSLAPTIDDALKYSSFDAAFICSPTAYHVSHLLKILQNKVRFIYLEKPVSNTLENIEEVRKLTKNYSNKIVMGFDLHFDPGMIKVKEMIKQAGIIISVTAFVGQHLAQWRPYEDYRKGMSAKKDTGGGVLLDLIHEFDYLYRLFGEVETVSCNMQNTGMLEIETEESADVLLKFCNGVSGFVHLDYWQPETKRFAIITGTEATITWDLAAKNVSIVLKDGSKETFEYVNFERNDRFKEAVKSFLEEKKDERFSTLEDGIKSLEMVLAAKQSAEENKTVKLQSNSYAAAE